MQFLQAYIETVNIHLYSLRQSYSCPIEKILRVFEASFDIYLQHTLC